MSTMGEAVDGQPVLFVEGKNVLSIIVKAYSPSSDQLPPTISEQGVSL